MHYGYGRGYDGLCVIVMCYSYGGTPIQETPWGPLIGKQSY